jgi:hypothetical protein
MPSKTYRLLSLLLAAEIAAISLPAPLRADAGPQTQVSDWTLADLKKPVWLSDLGVEAKQAYDDNVFGVSGDGLLQQTSWVNTLSFKIGVNFVPFLAPGGGVQTLSLTYTLDSASYSQASSENNIASRLNLVFKGKSGAFSWSLDDALLDVDGNKTATTYALNQLAATAAGSNQNDKYRNNYAHSLSRERKDQVQDRYTAFVQYDFGNVFIRPISQLTFFNLETNVFNTANAPYKGYQDYIDRWDLNEGADLGFKLAPKLAVTIGYRDGYQHQDGYSLAINSDTHQASNRYKRALLGLEGKLTDWLTVKLSAGPDFKVFNPDTPITHDSTTRYYGEGVATVTLPLDQSISVNYKQWFFVSSTGLVPYEDTTVAVVYHVNLTKQLGIDLGGKYQDANYTIGNDYAGAAPDLRDDGDWGASIGATYAVTPHFIVSVTYNYDDGENELKSLPAKYFPGYRDFRHNVVALDLKYKF